MNDIWNKTWSNAFAHRLSFLIDGKAYFDALALSIEQARHSISILGWDVDPRIQLQPGQSTESLKSLLIRVVQNNPQLHVRIVAWDFKLFYFREREFSDLTTSSLGGHERIQFVYDDGLPLEASRHEKMIVIDDQIAYLGGIDLSHGRWDTPAHAREDWRRRGPDGTEYPPHHDIQVMFDGPAARACGQYFRERWKQVTDMEIDDIPPVSEKRWPIKRVDFANTRLGIIRTKAAYGVQPAIREIESTVRELLEHASRRVFIEGQYLTSELVAEQLKKLLRQPEGPEIIILLPEASSSWIEKATMTFLQIRVLEELKQADRFQRLGAYCPKNLLMNKEGCLHIHSKLLIVDDRWILFGSANLTNRSLGLDSELNIVFESDSSEVLLLAHRLLAEHLGVPVALFSSVASDHQHKLVPTIQYIKERQCDRHRTLMDAYSRKEPDAKEPLIHPSLSDPSRPVGAFEFHEFTSDRSSARRRRLIIYGIGLSLACAATILIWHWIARENLSDFLTWMTIEHRESSWIPLLISSMLLLASLAMMPIVFVTIVCIVLFGPFLGVVYSSLISILSASLGFLLGRIFKQPMFYLMESFRLKNVALKMRKRTALTLLAVRLLPIAPFTIVNLAAGAMRFSFLPFLCVTLIALLPGRLFFLIVGESLFSYIRKPNPGSLVTFVLTTALGLVLLKKLYQKLRQRSGIRT